MGLGTWDPQIPDEEQQDETEKTERGSSGEPLFPDKQMIGEKHQDEGRAGLGPEPGRDVIEKSTSKQQEAAETRHGTVPLVL